HLDHPDDAQDVRLVVLPNPNSPSGTLVSVEHVARIAASLNCPLVVDEAYVDFAPTSCVSLVHEMPNVIVTRTLSKSYGLAGLRFGFALANPETIAGLSKIKDSYNCDALSIAAATAAINSQSWLRENVAKILKTRYRMFHQLSEMGFRVTPSHANFLWCTHPSGRHEELYAGLRNAGWLVRWMRFPDWGDGLRISVGTDEQIDACFDVLRSLVEGLDQ
ncbi:MAG: histidinol-phosphate transaminase, partial [Planctomycetota bacterium]